MLLSIWILWNLKVFFKLIDIISYQSPPESTYPDATIQVDALRVFGLGQGYAVS